MAGVMTMDYEVCYTLRPRCIIQRRSERELKQGHVSPLACPYTKPPSHATPPTGAPQAGRRPAAAAFALRLVLGSVEDPPWDTQASTHSTLTHLLLRRRGNASAPIIPSPLPLPTKLTRPTTTLPHTLTTELAIA